MCEEHAQGCHAALSRWELNPRPIDRKSNALLLRLWATLQKCTQLRCFKFVYKTLHNFKTTQLLHKGNACAYKYDSVLTRFMEGAAEWAFDWVGDNAFGSHDNLDDIRPKRKLVSAILNRLIHIVASIRRSDNATDNAPKFIFNPREWEITTLPAS